jgi:RNA polymerase sigma-70 factor (ECF subfamily)
MEKSAFNKLLREHKNQVFTYAFYVLRNREDAEDVTQEVFIKVWRNLEEIDENRCVAWMMKVAHNQCINLIRKHKGSSRHVENPERSAAESIPAAWPSATDPALNFESRETQRKLLLAMGRLPVKTKSMLLLHYYHGLKYETIGEILCMNVNTVKVDVHRGRKLLQEFLAKEFPERVREG